jgi:hypothetical protein
VNGAIREFLGIAVVIILSVVVVFLATNWKKSPSITEMIDEGLSPEDD